MKLVATAWVALVLFAPTLAVGVPQELWTARYPLLPGGSVSVENVQGDITIEGWDRAEAEVVVVKTASDPDGRAEDVQVAVELSEQALKLRSVYPRPSDVPIRVDYRLRVPRQGRLERLRTVEGNIYVRDFEGPVDARTLHGNIEQENVSGHVVARVINGNIGISLRALPERAAPLHLETVNGHVFLILPPRANADLALSTVAGRIDTPYAFAVSEAPGDTSRKARLGRGGVEIHLRTIRGDIHVAERDDLL